MLAAALASSGQLQESQEPTPQTSIALSHVCELSWLSKFCCTLQRPLELKLIGPANLAVTKASGVVSASASEGTLSLKHVRKASRHKEQGYAFSATYTAQTQSQVRCSKHHDDSSVADFTGHAVS